MDRTFNLPDLESAVNLTTTEEMFIKNLGVVIVCPDPDWPPFEYQDVDGQFCGIAADLVNLIFQRLPARFQCLWTKDWNETLSLSRAGKVHLLPFLNKTPEREAWLTFTDPVFVDPNVFVTRMEHPYIESTSQLSNEVIAFPEGTAVEKMAREKMPQLQFIHGQSELEVFQMVANGTADLTLRSLMVAAYTLGIENLAGLKIAGQIPAITNYLRIGVIKELSPLRDILNKAIATITPEDQLHIVNQHVNSKLAAAMDSSNAQMMLAVTFLTSSNWYWNYHLQRYNEEYGILLDYMQTQVWYLHNSFTYGSVNKAHAEFLGLSKQNLEHKNLWDVLPKEVAKIQVHQNQQVFSEKITLKSEEWFFNKKGKKRLLHITRVPKISHSGQVEYVVCSGVDITERYNMEQELLMQKEQFRTTLLSVSDAVISADKSCRVVVINQAASLYTGWNQDEAVGQPLEEVFSLVYEDTLKPYPLKIEEVVQGMSIAFDQPIALINRDGSIRSVEASLASIKEDCGQSKGIVVVFRDVTKKREKQRQAEYYSLRDPLTGLYNRRFFQEELTRLDVPRNLPFSLLLADVNGLKLTNDAFGHEAGDNLLKEIGKVLKEACRADDIVARIGGDEFVMLLPNTSLQDAVHLNERINKLMVGQEVNSIPLSLSCGIGTKEHPSREMRDVFKNAEKIMYKTKIADRKNHRLKALQNIKEQLFLFMPQQRLHSQKVGQLCFQLAKEMGLAGKELQEASIVGELHDIGKVAIITYMQKDESLHTLSEENEFRRHPSIGFSILISIEEYSPLAASVLAHHEKWDGTGYPNGLLGSAIPLYARIASVADTYDKLTENISNKGSLTIREAKERIAQGSGSQFDPKVVKALLKMSLI